MKHMGKWQHTWVFLSGHKTWIQIPWFQPKGVAPHTGRAQPFLALPPGRTLGRTLTLICYIHARSANTFPPVDWELRILLTLPEEADLVSFHLWWKCISSHGTPHPYCLRVKQNPLVTTLANPTIHYILLGTPSSHKVVSTTECWDTPLSPMLYILQYGLSSLL